MPFLEYNIFKRSLILLITFSCLSQTMVSNGSKQCNIVELYINLWLKLNVWEVIQVYFHYSGLLIKLYSYHGKPLLNWQEFQCIVLFFQCDAATRTFLRVHLVGHSELPFAPVIIHTKTFYFIFLSVTVWLRPPKPNLPAHSLLWAKVHTAHTRHLH